MDGLTISTAEGLISTGQTTSELRESKLKGEIAGQVDSPTKSFENTLKDAVEHVNQLQMHADKKIQDLSTGKSKNIPEVMIAAEKADIALKLMVQVRNKMIDAYQEIMKMQV